MTLKIFSMFSGIGGFELGIQNSTLKTRHHTKPELVGYSEIDKYAIQIFEKHFEGVKNFGDATQIRGDELPDFDVLVGGFPCQAFSIAGKREGFGDTRGTLFFDIARICAEKRPKYLVLENVRGLLSHDEGKTFQTILRVLADLGYAVEWQVLNSKDFGVPQNRQRIFIVGYLGGFPRRILFSNEGAGTKSDTDLTLQKEDCRLLKELTQGKSQGERVYDPSGLSVTLASQAGGLGAKTGLYQVENHRIRRLTPVECERLQGFPDGWTEGFSDTRRYKTLGNAVTTNVITALFNALAETIVLEQEIAA